MLRLHLRRFIRHNLQFSHLNTYGTSAKPEFREELVQKYASRLVYNTIIAREKNKLYIAKSRLYKNNPNLGNETSKEPIPLTLKYLDDSVEEEVEETEEIQEDPQASPNFPFETSHKVEDAEIEENEEITDDFAQEVDSQIRERLRIQKEMKTWMTAYDNFDDDLEEEEDGVSEWRVNYGTPDPKSEVSKVPCGGCGALLHCKDTAIPGYIPSEIFKNNRANGGSNLEAITCQRCHFLKHYNIALQTQVAPEDYTKILQTIRQKGGLVILMVDLLDFPCSIWPGIGEIFGFKFPMVIVGNKIDLLPKDSNDFLHRVKTTLVDYVKLHGFASFNIKNVELISCKTGYGIEDLITKLCALYRIKGNVYIVGTTNVGKSSLFNAFIQSDYCKSQAIDLIQRATTSIWPGTTLNLLKFPIKRPAGIHTYLRHHRLQQLKKLQAENDSQRLLKLKRTKNAKYASLIGHIDITKNPDKEPKFKGNNFGLEGSDWATGRVKMGLDESSMDYMYSKWCFDTPGVVQPDQITHFLTTEELTLTLPKEIIEPRSFCLKPGLTLFIAGLSRLDYVQGPQSVRLTVFASNQLPITVCNLTDANEVYEELLGTELFAVPSGNPERLAKWPRLELAQKFSVTGEHWKKSAKDIVLSSSGWIAITGKQGLEYEFQAWTPEKRGVYLRDCLLPYAIALKGHRVKRSVAYKPHRFYLS